MARRSGSIGRSVASALVLAVLTCASSRARAEPTSEDAALASVLFEDGRKLMQEGRHAEACPKLEESQRLDPGGGTLLNLALCHEAVGRYATALGELTEARGIARREGRQDRVDLAQEHLDAIGPKLSFLQLDVAKVKDVPGLEIARNGRVISSSVFGTRIPVDPGKHTIEARAPGYQPFSTDVEVTEPGARPLEIPALVKLQEPAPTLPPTPAPFVLPPMPPPSPQEKETSPFVWAGIGVGAVGAACLTAGAISAGIAATKRSESEDIAPSCENGCSQDAVDRNDEAKVAADVATGTIVAGGIAGAAGIILVVIGLTSDGNRPAAAAAFVDVAPRGASLRVHF